MTMGQHSRCSRPVNHLDSAWESGTRFIMPLVYDIGLHDGGDTRQYLKEGCRVIAVDANPAMCVAAARELEQEIEAGRLTILNRGIAERAGTARFWICDDVSEWSSFHRSIASRNGVTHHAIDVECVTIQEIIGQYGVPLYMKIDIEGNDKHCIAGLSTDMRPRYVSIEMDHEAGHREIRQLHSLGYRRFKIICQNNHWNQVTLSNLWFYRLGPESPFTTRLQRIDR